MLKKLTSYTTICVWMLKIWCVTKVNYTLLKILNKILWWRLKKHTDVF